MTAYYNEFDPKAAAWLRELIRAGHIADGVVDTRSIEDVTPNDLRDFTQCHFFAGIGGWSYALRLAGVRDDTPAWTGSCPCQPFSAAGKGMGFADERHLWPAWFHLIRSNKPELIFGEQVANALPWIDLVSTDLEAEGYAWGNVVLGAHSVGAPHQRQRLYWVGHTKSGYRGRDARRGRRESANDSDVGHRHRQGLAQRIGNGSIQQKAMVALPWEAAISASYVDCRDGKRRPVEPGTFPLAHGVPERVGLLRGYGNAIVPQVAEAFIRAALG